MIKVTLLKETVSKREFLDLNYFKKPKIYNYFLY